MPPESVHFVREPESGDTNVTCPTCARKLGAVSYGLAPDGSALCASGFNDERDTSDRELGPAPRRERRDPPRHLRHAWLPRSLLPAPPALSPSLPLGFRK